MQTPVYSPSVPSYINAAALGSLLAEHLATFTVTNNGRYTEITDIVTNTRSKTSIAAN